MVQCVFHLCSPEKERKIICFIQRLIDCKELFCSAMEVEKSPAWAGTVEPMVNSPCFSLKAGEDRYLQLEDTERIKPPHLALCLIQAFSGLVEAHHTGEDSQLYSVYRFKCLSHPETSLRTQNRSNQGFELPMGQVR